MARKKREEAGVDVTLPITPMLDMSFQLLSFFILTFHPMPQEGQLAINLPKPDTSNQIKTPEPVPEDENKKDEWTISVYAKSDEMTLQGPTSKRDGLKYDDLKKELRDLPPPAGKGKAGISITIEGEQDLIYAKLIDIMNLCKASGYDSVGVGLIRAGK